MPDPLPDEIQNLITVGLSFLKTRNSPAMREYAWHEFQRYAQLPYVAQETPATQLPGYCYAARLKSVPNVATDETVYSGPIDGLSTPTLKTCLSNWVSRSYRIPVVVSAWEYGEDCTQSFYPNLSAKRGDSILSGKENVWFCDEKRLTDTYFYVSDFSNQFDIVAPTVTAADTKDLARFVYLGRDKPYVDKKGVQFHGPGEARHKLSSMDYSDLTGGNCGGNPCPEPATEPEISRQSTFRVLAGVAAAEVDGSLDLVDCFDPASLSVGLCQWSAGVVTNGTLPPGELGGFFALMKRQTVAADPNDAWNLMAKKWGYDVEKTWEESYISGEQKYATHLSEIASDNAVRLLESELDAKLLRGWHTFYRFVGAARSSQSYRRRMWDMARVRLRSIRNTPWPDPPPPPKTAKPPKTKPHHIPRSPDGTPATIGEVFRSELALALIMRVHVISPASIVSGGHVGDRLCAVFDAAFDGKDGLNGFTTLKVDEFDDAIENKLCHSLQRRVLFLPELKKSIPKLLAVHVALQPSTLQQDRSFSFEDSGLPPMAAAPASNTGGNHA